MRCSACRLLGPGAHLLEKKIDDPSLDPSQRINPDMLVRDMGLREWTIVLKAFGEWPFAPVVSMRGSSWNLMADQLAGS